MQTAINSPSSRLSTIAAMRCLDVWAACERHRSEGGTGYPTVREVFAGEIGGRVIAVSEMQGKAESDLLKDATPRKYERSPSVVRLPIDSLSCREVVHCAMAGCRTPAHVAAYLRIYYPTRGAFALPEDECHRLFRDWLRDQLGQTLTTARVVKAFDRAFRSLSYELITEIQRLLDLRSDLAEFRL